MKPFKEIIKKITQYSEKEFRQASDYNQEYHKYCQQHKESLERGHFTLELGQDTPPLNLLLSAFDDSSELDISITGSVGTNTDTE